MNQNKQILDYREPFNAPYMIREIAKNVNLPFVVYAQDFTVATVSFAVVFSFLLLVFGMNQLVIIISIAIPYGLVQLFNRIEPEGKRADIFLKDYLTYLFTFILKHKVLYHEQLESLKQEKIIYGRCTIQQLAITKGEEEMYAISFEQFKQELCDELVPELFQTYKSVHSKEEGFYGLFETDDEVLLMKKTLYQQYVDGIIPFGEVQKLKDHYTNLIKQSLQKRISRLL